MTASDPGQETTASRQLAALAVDAFAWDDTEAAAVELRERFRGLVPGKRAGLGPGEQALLTLRLCSDKRQLESVPRKLATLSSQVGEDVSRWVAPFLGDPALGEWPFWEAETIDDDDALMWLPLVGRHALLTERERTFLLVFFLHRRRQLWIAASCALSWAALRDAALRDRTASLWGRYFPRGLPGQWTAGILDPDLLKPTSGSVPPMDERSNAAHVARHLLHLAAVHAAAGGAPDRYPGFSAPRLASIPFSGKKALSGTDASAVLIALEPLADRDLLPLILERAKEAPPDEQVTGSVRLLVERLEHLLPPEQWRPLLDRLRRPDWTDLRGGKRIDVLWSWLETAAWFHQRGDSNSVAAMRGLAGEASEALALRLDGALPGGATCAVEALLSRLRTVFDDALFVTTGSERQALAVVELLLLLDHTAVREIPWPPLVTRALGRTAGRRAREGAAGQVGWLDLLLLPHITREMPAVLLRDERLDRQVVVALASNQNGFVARQVALQSERLLRELPDPADRVRFLWQLLRADPPTKTFHELRVMLRGLPAGLGSLRPALAEIVDRVCELDKLRGRLEKGAKDPSPRTAQIAAIVEIAAGYKGLVEATDAYLAAGPHHLVAPPAPPLGGTTGDARAALDGLAKTMEELPGLGAFNLEPRVIEAWLERARYLLAPHSAGGALDGWMAWVDSPIPGLDRAFTRFEIALKRIAETGPAIELGHAQELARTSKSLNRHLGGVAWPESRIASALLADIGVLAARSLDVARKGALLRERLIACLNRGQSDDLLRILGDPSVDVASAGPEVSRRIHRFLLGNLLVRDAMRFRDRIRDRAQLPSIWSFLSNLVVGTAAGTFLVLDVGTAWNEVLSHRDWRPLGATVLLAVMASVTLLVSHVAVRMGRAFGGRWWRVSVLGRAAVRVLPLLGLSLAVAAATSTLVLWTLEGTSLRVVDGRPLPLGPQLLLWATLSQFLGLFLGLLAQGRGATEAE